MIRDAVVKWRCFCRYWLIWLSYCALCGSCFELLGSSFAGYSRPPSISSIAVASVSEKGSDLRDFVDPVYIHHTAIKTRNITNSIQFYTILGFEVSCKFRAGAAKAAWLQEKEGKSGTRLELIEVPSYMLREPEGMKRMAIDLMKRQEMLGYNHLALDVTESMQLMNDVDNLSDWIDKLNLRSLEMYGKTLRVALQPEQKIIGSGVYELAFLYDADGALVELLRKQSDLQQTVGSGWEPLDFQGLDVE